MTSAVMLLSTRSVFHRKPGLMHALIIAVLGFSIYALFFQSSGALIEGLGRDATMSGRTVGWPIILSYASNDLIGAGYESFWLGPRLQKLWEEFPGLPIGEAHNGYIEIFLILGWIGVVLLGILIATGYRNVLGAYRRDPTVGSLRIAFFLAAVVTGFTEAAFRMMSLTWFVFVLATTGAAMDTARSRGYRRQGR